MFFKGKIVLVIATALMLSSCAVIERVLPEVDERASTVQYLL
jgi:hypothetical protein